MIPSDELHALTLPNGDKMIASVTEGPGLRVTRFDAESRELASLDIGYPSAGFEGGGWVLSPSGGLVILHCYSGQSEETFVLLNLSNRGLTIVAHPEYQFGEYASYAFSADEDRVVMALPRTCVEWWAWWEDDGLEAGDDGVEFFPFATLIVCSIITGKIRRTELEVVPTVTQPIHTGEYNPDLAPRLFPDLKLSLQLPWGIAEFDLSMDPIHVRIPYPSQSVS